MDSELLDYVDEDDKVLWTVERGEIYKQKLTHRICHVMVINSQWEIALQKRSQQVKYMPWAWCTSAGGHVCSGHTYVESAAKELQEEIGISWELQFRGKFQYDIKDRGISIFVWLFELSYEGDFSYEDGEAEVAEWFSLETIREMLDWWHSFHPQLVHILQEYYF